MIHQAFYAYTNDLVKLMEMPHNLVSHHHTTYFYHTEITPNLPLKYLSIQATQS